MSNFDPFNRLLELIQESKSLMRMGIQLPESAIDVLKQVCTGRPHVFCKVKCLIFQKFKNGVSLTTPDQKL